MIIFDTKNNYEGRIKGTLHFSVMDADYILKKYTPEYLYNNISYDYTETIIEECEYIDSPVDQQYFSIITLGVETPRDEALLNIIKEEYDKGNLFTKSDIENITASEAEDLITQLLEGKEVPMNAPTNENLSRVYYKYSYYDLTLEELYQLRTYEMIKYTLKQIDEANHQKALADEQINPYGINDMKQYERATDKLRYIRRNLENMGLSDEITESDYFKKPTGPVLTKK